MNGTFDIGAVTPFRYFAAIAVSLGLVFAFIGGDDSAGSGILSSVFQWQLQTVVPMFLLVVSHMVLARWRRFQNLGSWSQLFISGLAGVILFTPIAEAIDRLFVGVPDDSTTYTASLISELVGVGPPILLAWLAINSPWVMGLRLQREGVAQPSVPPPATAEEPAEPTSSPANDAESGLEQLAEVKLDDVLMVKAELHYLTLQSSAGKKLVLYNLRDAVSELGEQRGFQCHRSYWLAHKFVDQFERSGRQGELVTQDGQRIPVSRNNVQRVIGIVNMDGKNAE